MVDITPLISSHQQVIQGYRDREFRVSGTTYEGPIIVFPDKVLKWSVGDKGTLEVDDFAVLCTQEEMPDVVLFGSGSTMEFYPPSFKQDLKDQGLFIEVMDTGAACRTYNVLLADGRRVAAALLPVGK